ncbi:diacylglycerol kinase [Georgenia halophila]|uniref:Diacylglycerol kinase n=1 Tax=Georgenia halophila TaxID=620889 RepID=A0ABP8LAW4_9MICO
MTAVLALANAAAGSADDDAVESALDALRARADTEVVVPDGSEEMDRALRAAAGRQVVVLGGDGSVHGCVAALFGAGLLDSVGPLGIVPLGTGNDLAGGLGLPEDPQEAARVAIEGTVRPMDVLVDDEGDDGGIVVNVVHAGVGAEAAASASAVKGALGVAGYLVGAAAAGMSTTGWRLRVVADGEVVHDGAEPVLMVGVALGTTIGGGTPVAPMSSPGSGLAEVIVSTATGPVERAAFAADMRQGRHLDRDDVWSTHAAEITVESTDGEPFRLNTDGDVTDPVLRRTWRVHPGAWSCRVPEE